MTQPGPNLPYENNMGSSALISRADRVVNQYGQVGHGYIGAEGHFRSVFDSRSGLKVGEQFQIWNIQTLLGNYTLPSETTERKLAILGRMTWGVGGAIMQVDFDWKMGGQLSVAASFVRIEAAFSETDDAPDDVRVIANLASGSRAARSQVTRTFPQVRISGGEGAEVVLFPIPPFAHALNLFADDMDFYDVDEVQVRFVGGVSSSYSAATTDFEAAVLDGSPFLNALASEDGVRFPEAAKFVELSTTAETAYLVTPCFTLNL
jgi:hypothetical protein